MQRRRVMVNKHELIKNDKFLVAALLLAVGVVEWGATYLIYKNPKLEPDIQQRRSKDVSSCSRFAKDLGYQVSTKSRSGIEITNLDFSDPKLTYLNVKQLALGCVNMEPVSFCLGTGETCGIEGASYGLKVNMTFKEPKSN
jgi:hypothetical protein